MITTRFLGQSEYAKFAEWLKNLDRESRDTYFGTAVSDAFVDTLIEKITTDWHKHDFLVAEQDGKWVGVLHIARVSGTEIEFGLSVDKMIRGMGLGDRLLKEGILWARNRGYMKLYLHCLVRNERMKRLAEKNGLRLHKEYDEYDACTLLPPASFVSFSEELIKRQSDVFVSFLQAGTKVIPVCETED